MSKKIIESNLAPAPIGPYSQAVEVNGMLFVSGIIALVPGTDNLVMDSIEAETHQVMKNMLAVLNEAGLSFDHIVKSSIFLMNMADFATVNTVYGSYFKSDFPARETVQVAGLPKGVRVEISVIAAR
jgi:2-iminobutanoate/2-iminopropanoate deaminase